MQFLKTDYRGTVQYLKEWAELRQTLGLGRFPHYSKLCYAHQRFLRPTPFAALLHAVWERAQETSPSLSATGVVDAIGLGARHVSHNYVWRAGYRRFTHRHGPKLSLVGDAETHLIGAAVISWDRHKSPPSSRLCSDSPLVKCNGIASSPMPPTTLNTIIVFAGKSSASVQRSFP